MNNSKTNQLNDVTEIFTPPTETARYLNNEQAIEFREITTTTQLSKASKKAPPEPGHIHIREQKGIFQRIRTSTNSLLVCLFFMLPFISYQDHQAILFDLSQQQFIFFSTTLWPQDFTVLAWVFITAAFLLFFITVFWGRIWCGYLCPQTAWTFMYVWIETRIEGNQNKRIALDKAPWSSSKLIKRLIKHTTWGITALLTGCAFIAYFVPARELYIDILSFQASFWVAVWVWFFAICTYLNAGWMREQMCLHCCPYSKFQSVMFDANTKTVTYDANRGESRGPRKRKQHTELGDCVDCHLCVDVCPTGIDIRNGLQYECINCGACVDACNQTMDKFGYPKNLISYVSEYALKGQNKPVYRSLKFIGYGVSVLVMLVVIGIDMANKSDIQLNVLRDRQHLYRETSDNLIENSYTLKIRNKTQQIRHYLLSVDNSAFQLENNPQLVINPGEQLTHPVTLIARSGALTTNRTAINILITEVDKPDNSVFQQTNFFGPG
ncbi:cytochrome c oxidase accessory protein CcoG [Shewanella sp. D64]|uniref:cytochrome c oxidase accessory protein CcoG n=1 Tax=unclassified Shewanella TaxID=196818 RepID=UPI0022BA3BA9|nr:MULTISPECIES: cytochrome c oxidase accessory protein CcoG [unclassified Shewanella]MEC4725011.1 cytochrome c oxidase accessory protein CcoG [Shewanella sp. D64]MEC4736912.1 cytochrome c oxidase accessory protein CcoG [Shewanella sp. E94]WBJ96508.1 cytochrome c oxidase accessory protein CcoG [Shewanella sp. MTB7]